MALPSESPPVERLSEPFWQKWFAMPRSIAAETARESHPTEFFHSLRVSLRQFLGNLRSMGEFLTGLDASKKIPGAGRWYHELTRYHWFVLLVAALGWMFDCLDQQLFTLSRQPAMRDLLAESGRNAAEYGGYCHGHFPAGLGQRRFDVRRAGRSDRPGQDHVPDDLALLPLHGPERFPRQGFGISPCSAFSPAWASAANSPWAWLWWPR